MGRAAMSKINLRTDWADLDEIAAELKRRRHHLRRGLDQPGGMTSSPVGNRRIVHIPTARYGLRRRSSPQQKSRANGSQRDVLHRAVRADVARTDQDWRHLHRYGRSRCRPRSAVRRERLQAGAASWSARLDLLAARHRARHKWGVG
jgi:hypothetical protein